MTWDTSTPAGSEALSNGDNRMRELKDDIQVALRGNTTDGLEAKFPGSDTANPVFRYRGLKGTTGSRPASGQYGLYTDTSRNALQRDNGSSWEDIATLIPAGTVMVFYQAAAPVGWTKLTTQNDKALRVVSGTGGGSGGSAPISTGITHTVASHTHTISSDGAHTHTVASHTHTTPNHVHELAAPFSITTALDLGSGGHIVATPTAAANQALAVVGSTGGALTRHQRASSTDSGGSGTSGAATPATDSQGAHTHGGATGAATPTTDTVIVAYIDVLICSKD